MSEWSGFFAEFGVNLALLISLTFFYGLLIRKFQLYRGAAKSAVEGALFGAIAILGMQLPMHVAPGIIVDGRTVIVMLAGSFAGPVAGLVAGALVSGFRFYLGGVGALAGIGAIASALAVGLVFRSRFFVEPAEIKARHLLAMALPMTAISLAWIFALPGSIDALPLLSRISLPVGIMYPLTALLLGLMLAQEHRRLRLVERLRENEERFRDFAEFSSDWFWETDAGGRLIWQSDRGGSTDGLTFDLVQGMTRPEIAGAEMSEEDWRPYQQALQAHTDIRDFEYRYPGRDGKSRLVVLSGHALFDESGAYIGHRGTATDYTERRHVEKSALEAKAQLDSAIQSFSDGFVLFDADDRFVLANDYYLDAHPMIRKIQVPGTKIETVVRELAEVGFYGNAPDQIERTIAERLEKYHAGATFEYCMDDGRWIQMNQFRTRDGGQALVRIDITELKSMEHRLANAQKMEAVGQLTGGIAHDFNNLLAVMIGNAEMLKLNTAGDDKNRQSIEAIIRSAERGAALTSRLLAFSRQQPLSPSAVDVAELIVGLEDMFRRTLGETIELRVAAVPGLWPALTDPHQFENALLNLAINARDAMPTGGELVIESANVTLGAAFAGQQEELTPGDYIKVAVSDTGSGMAPETLEKIFEPFFTTKDVGQGSGLGLSMVYGFAKQSQGHVTIDSEVGAGTTVNLYLPRSLESMAEKGGGDATATHKAGLERILVVEDDASVRLVPVSILRSQGYEVAEAANGREAIGLLQDDPPFDLLFTDVILPGGMNGVEIAEQARRLQPGISVLFTTGYAESTVAVRGKLDAAATLVHKPYRQAELLEKVRALLDDGGGR